MSHYVCYNNLNKKFVEIISMNYKIAELQEKTIMGISARKNNSSPEMSAVIGGLWEKFYGGIYRQIPHKANEFTLGIYMECENKIL